MSDVEYSLVGAIAVASFLAGLFFLRFWHRTRDSFFLYFAASFWLEGLNRLMLGIFAPEGESSPLFYGVRLIAYGLIIVAILQKNRRRP
jgi:hypothetical protein